MNAQELLKAILESIVDEPEKVEVERKVDEMGVLLIVRVGESDRGQVIGKKGNTANAIRSIIRIIGIKNRERVNVKIDIPALAPRKKDDF